MYKFAINRPISTLMLMVSFIVFGSLSYKSMPVNLFPDVELPIVTIETTYHGADPETVESKVTDKIEAAVSTIEGIDKLRSTSFEGFSLVTIQFELSRDITEAANDVRDKVGGIALDSGVEKPVVKKVSGASGAVVALFASTSTMDPKAFMQLINDRLKPRVERIGGVGEVELVGYQEREIRIYTDPFLLNKYRLSAAGLSQILSEQNVRMGGGKLIGEKDETLLKIRADAKSVAELERIVIAPGVRLKDVARVEDGLEDPKSYASLNGEAGVMLEVKKVSGANTLEIIGALKEIEPELQEIVGKEVTLAFLQDQSSQILQSINQVRDDLIFGAFLAVAIVFFFLRNGTATFVSALAIPTSIIGTFALVDWLGYDLNRLTLIGLTLAIGIFIDDAIVIIENISKKMEEGKAAFEAAHEGIRELAFAILANSAMLLAVFVPVAFMDGIVGRFFNSFAMTVAAGVLISYIIAVMLIPSVGARFLQAKQGRFYHKSEPYFEALDKGYRRLLAPLIRYKYVTVLGVCVLLYASSFLLSHVGNDFVPMEDKSEMQILIKAPVGISLEAMKKEMEPFEAMLKADARIENFSLVIGYTTAKELHRAKFYIRLKPLGERQERQEAIVQQYREQVKEKTALHVNVEEVPMIDAGGSNAPVQIVLRGPELEALNRQSKALMALLEGISGVVDVDSDFEEGTREMRIGVLYENARRAGVDAASIAATIGASFSSLSPISYFEEEGKQYDITLRMEDGARVGLGDIEKLRVMNASGQMIPLEGLVRIEEGEGATSINRFDKERSVLVTANLFGVPLDAVAREVRQRIGEVLEEGYSYRFTGDVEMMEETNEAFMMAVMLAVVLIYLILASLYESLIQPLIIMVSMPLSFVGVVVGLYLGGMPFSLFVMIGMILLLGMVGKNAVLVVDFANQAIKEGKEVEEALLEAGQKRLRPILMTTMAMIFAMLPLALSQGAGHEGNAPMAIAVIGGLISSTLLTLLVVPSFYRILYPLDRWLRTFYEKGKI